MKLKLPVRFSTVRKLLILPPVLVGAGVLAWAVSSRRTPEPQPVREIARPLRVVTAERRDVAPEVVGYGLARPARTWRAVARVSGTVVETHVLLDAGLLVRKDTVLLRIDPTDYELQVDRLSAEADALRAQIAETETLRENDRATLGLPVRSLGKTAEMLSPEQAVEITLHATVLPAAVDEGMMGCSVGSTQETRVCGRP